MNILYFASVDFYQKPNPSFHLMHSMITDLLENGNKINFVGCAIDGIDRHIPRNIAQLIDLSVISKSPIIGVGFNEYFNQVRVIGTLFGQNWTMAANTFTFMGAIFGIPYTLVTVIGIAKVCPRNARNV